jgi:hypothetical protein
VRTVLFPYFAMVKDEPGAGRVLFFADGGVVPDPDRPARGHRIATADNFRALTGSGPRRVPVVLDRGRLRTRTSTRSLPPRSRAKRAPPDLHLDGGPGRPRASSEVAGQGAGSIVAGTRTCCVPTSTRRTSGKLVQRLGRMDPRPIQGLAKPANDLSALHRDDVAGRSSPSRARTKDAA